MTEFCPACAGDREIRRELRRVEYQVKGEAISLELPVLICPVCGTEEVDPAFGKDPVELAFAVYRERHGLLTPEQIKSIRQQYGLSQKSFAAIMGMSEATINRYEGGSLQETSHDTAIRACQDPNFVRSLLRLPGHQLPLPQQQKLLDSLTAQFPGL